MNLLLLRRAESGAGEHRLCGARAERLQERLRGRSRVWAGIQGADTMGHLTVARLDRDEVVLTGALNVPVPQPTLQLALAIPRPKALRRLLPQVAALGVQRVDLVRTWNVQRQYLDSPMLQSEAMASLIEDGMEQGMWTRAPKIRVYTRFMEWIEEGVVSLASGSRWVGDPRGRNAPAPASGAPAIAVGPEGGWALRELESLERAGFERVAAGRGILRSDTAAIVLLGRALAA